MTPKMPTKSYLRIYHSKDTRQSPCNNLGNIGDFMSQHEYKIKLVFVDLKFFFPSTIFFILNFLFKAILSLQIKSQRINIRKSQLFTTEAKKMKFWKQKHFHLDKIPNNIHFGKNILFFFTFFKQFKLSWWLPILHKVVRKGRKQKKIFLNHLLL